MVEIYFVWVIFTRLFGCYDLFGCSKGFMLFYKNIV